MSWKRHLYLAPPNSPKLNQGGFDKSANSSGKSESFLPEVYAGHPNRILRYYQYADMDKDCDVSTALDIIVNFCTQSEEQTNQPFKVNYLGDVNETETAIIRECLTKWIKLNNFKSRLGRIIRDTIQYGDTFFTRDPETGEWIWLDNYSVLMVKIDEEKGRVPEEYIVKGLDYCRASQFGTRSVDTAQYSFGGAQMYGGNRPMTASSSPFALIGSHMDNRRQRPGASQTVENTSHAIDSKHIVHLSRASNMDTNWPFGKSILEPVYKVFKQKEMLEDSILIYRIQRAPERRVYYVDVGNMPPHRAQLHLEQFKNELHQRRFPTRGMNGESVVDTTYNPMSMQDDIFFAQTPEGKGSKVEILPGGDNLGEIGDLTFFTKKLQRGLRIPPTYMSMGSDEGGMGASYNDGRMGQAAVQEWNFTKYCMDIQTMLAPTFEADFKRYVKERGFMIDESLYEIQFFPPQNFRAWRTIEMDTQRASLYMQFSGVKHLAERFKLKRFLGLTDDEILENERLWKEENAEKTKKSTGTNPEDDTDTSLADVGIRPDSSGGFGGGDDMGLGGGGGQSEEPQSEPSAEPSADAGANPAPANIPPPTPPGGAPK